MPVEQENICYISFSYKQIFNQRPIKKLDNLGRRIELVSVSFPHTSKYAGWYISINKRNIYPSKGSSKMAYTRLFRNATFKIYKFNKETRETITKEIPVEELKKEFESWQEKNTEFGNFVSKN